MHTAPKRKKSPGEELYCLKGVWRYRSPNTDNEIVGIAAVCCFFFQAEDGIRDLTVTGVQTCALPISALQEGDAALASVLDELERVLLDVAHSPEEVTPAQLDKIRQKIEAQGILFKVRDRKSVV